MAFAQKQQTIYWIVFVAAFLGVAIWESLRPNRALSISTERRWLNHAGLFFVSGLLGTLVRRAAPIAFAFLASDYQWGLFHRITAPAAVQWFVTVVFLDLTHYATHRMFHHVGFLWRIHEVHHSDPDYDVTTGARFHPVESLIVQGSVLLAVLALGAPAGAVFLAELISLVINFVEHANSALPRPIEAAARVAFITPDLHRIHHSVEIADQNSNFGQTLCIWDRLFGTFAPKHRFADAEMKVGLDGFEGVEACRLGFMLAQPFQNKGTNDVIAASAGDRATPVTRP